MLLLATCYGEDHEVCLSRLRFHGHEMMCLENWTCSDRFEIDDCMLHLIASQMNCKGIDIRSFIACELENTSISQTDYTDHSLVMALVHFGDSLS